MLRITWGRRNAKHLRSSCLVAFGAALLTLALSTGTAHGQNGLEGLLDLLGGGATGDSGSAGAGGDTAGDGQQAFDACGQIVQGVNCAVFEGGGGTYALAEFGGFDFGEPVRVIGTLDPNCVTICAETDGCIRGATLYDPAAFPCGTDLPDLPGDLISETCSATALGLSGLAALGMCFAPRRP